MMSTTNADHDREQDERANELYWSSDRSVNDLADDLELSKGALYGLIRPRPAGLTCPECGGEMQYANRTARDRGYVTCEECGLEEEEDLVQLEDGDASALSGWVGSAPATRALIGTALLGIAAGFALAHLVDRDG